MAAAGVQAVIEVHSPQPVEADHAVKLRQNPVQIVNKVISGIGHMTGVKTDVHLIPLLHAVPDLPQLLKAAADLGALNAILTPEQSTTVLLETMSGKGSEVGGRFEELREILDRVELSDRMGVCLDTCHVSDAGYALAEDLDGVLMEFDRVIGLNRLKAIHLNDSLNPCGAHKDRHARIGEGCIGLEALRRVVNHPALKDLPFCLETPNELPGYAAEIALMRSLAE